MIVPAVGIVIRYYYRSFFPLWRSLQAIDGFHEKLLFEQRTRVSSMTVLVAGCLEITYRGQATRIKGVKKSRQIVLMVGLTVVTDLGDIPGWKVLWIRGRCKILKRFMVCDIVSL